MSALESIQWSDFDLDTQAARSADCGTVRIGHSSGRGNQRRGSVRAHVAWSIKYWHLSAEAERPPAWESRSYLMAGFFPVTLTQERLGEALSVGEFCKHVSHLFSMR